MHTSPTHAPAPAFTSHVTITPSCACGCNAHRERLTHSGASARAISQPAGGHAPPLWLVERPHFPLQIALTRSSRSPRLPSAHFIHTRRLWEAMPIVDTSCTVGAPLLMRLLHGLR